MYINKSLMAVWPDCEALTIIERRYDSKHFASDLETGNVEGQGQRHRAQWIVLIMVHIHVEFERLIINSFPTMDLNTNLH